jgi:hypothetical protein
LSVHTKKFNNFIVHEEGQFIMSLTRNLVVAFGFVATLGSQAANATCGITYSTGENGQTVVSGTPCESPSPAPAPVIHNGGTGGDGGDGGDGGAAAAQAAAQAAALAAAQAAAHSSSSSAGGSSTIQAGAVVANPSATATVAPGAVVANPSATATTSPVDVRNAATNEGNTVNIRYPDIKQATPINVANAPGTIAGCAYLSGFSISGSVVGAGAIGTSFTTGAQMIPDCSQAEMNKAIVVSGIASDDPAKNVLAVVVSGNVAALDEVTEERMALFGRQKVPAQPGNVALNQNFYGQSATTTTQPQFVCNYVDKKTGTVMRGEIITVQGQPVCKTGRDAPAPQ